MKKIGIITIVRVNNYGAELQAFALQKKLELMGYDAEIIDYLYYKHKNHRISELEKPWIDIGYKRKVKEFLYPIIYALKTFFKKEQGQHRINNFDSFHKKNTRFSEVQYSSMKELYMAQFPYEIFLVGSDQVWNPWSKTSLDPYFLTFAPKGKKRISYASSFGVSELPQQSIEKFTDRLNELDDISVRESQGVDIVKKITGRAVQHVLDPTLLLSCNDWNKVATPPEFSEEYILLYLVTSSKYAMSVAAGLSELTKYKVVNICKEAVSENKSQTFVNIVDAGPSEFLGWCSNASVIVTNSFHGTAFSIVFNRPFFSIIGKNRSNTSRQESLLSLLNLNSRILREGDSLIDENPLNIDFYEANNILQIQIEYSVSYLARSIN